ncbi:MAG: hypothetical protein FWG22_00670 [Prolixibacteraceae bacterium]|nr:hypothetical protein [Prolixibacteraceae bacterium]
MENFTWSKDLVSPDYTINSGNEKMGFIRSEGLFGNRALAEFDGKSFLIRRDFFVSNLEIFDGKHEARLASLSSNFFTLRGELIINGKRFEIEAKNGLQSGWMWKFDGEEIITYNSDAKLSRQRGTIEVATVCNEEIEILILMGLYLHNHVLTMILLIFILFILAIL